jgi:hypothetical protein
MGGPVHIYEDEWGEIIDHPDDGFTEIRWYDSTSAMQAEDFQQWLTTFAGYVEQLRRPGVLIDSTSFLMDPSFMDAAWRDEHIVPRYNAAGVKKFAFQFREECRRSEPRRRSRGSPHTPPLISGDAETRRTGWGPRHDIPSQTLLVDDRKGSMLA